MFGITEKAGMPRYAARGMGIFIMNLSRQNTRSPWAFLGCRIWPPRRYRGQIYEKKLLNCKGIVNFLPHESIQPFTADMLYYPLQNHKPQITVEYLPANRVY